MTVKQWIDILSTLDPDRNLSIIYDGSNRSGSCYSNGEYDLSDLQIMCSDLAKYLNDYWSYPRIYPSSSDIPIYSPGDYCIMAG